MSVSQEEGGCDSQTHSLGNPHPSLPQSQQTSLRADSLDVGTRQIVLGENVLLEIDIVAKSHTRRVQTEDVPLSLRGEKFKEAQ